MSISAMPVRRLVEAAVLRQIPIPDSARRRYRQLTGRTPDGGAVATRRQRRGLPNPSRSTKMRVMVIVKASPESESGKLPDPEMFAAMGRFNEELMKAGVLLAADGLQPSARGKRVRFAGSARTVSDGPFPQVGELVAGFWLWQVASMDEAVEWVKRCPNPMESDSDIEIRPLYEMADFADVLTPEVLERKERLRDEIGRTARDGGGESSRG
jgi:hypothetical protein